MRPTLATVTAVVPALIQAEGQQHVGVLMVSMDLSVPAKKVSNDEIYYYFLKRSNTVFKGVARDFIMLKPHKNENEEIITNQIMNNKGADQSARMCRLVYAFVVRKQQS